MSSAKTVSRRGQGSPPCCSPQARSPGLGTHSPPVLIDEHGVKRVAFCGQLEEGDELYKSAWCLKLNHTHNSLTRTLLIWACILSAVLPPAHA